MTTHLAADDWHNVINMSAPQIGYFAGFQGFLVVIQDATGSRTLAYTASKFRAPGSTAPILSTSPNNIDILEVVAYDTNRLNIVANYGFGDIT